MEIKSSMFVLDIGVLRGQTRVLIYYRGETKSQSWRDFVSEETEQRLATQSSLYRAVVLSHILGLSLTGVQPRVWTWTPGC